MSSRLKKANKKVAKEKVIELFKKADSSFPNQELVDEYVMKARRIAMKHKIRLGKLKRKFCKHCYSYLKPGVNCRIRTNEGKLVIYCKACKRYTRLVYKV